MVVNVQRLTNVLAKKGTRGKIAKKVKKKKKRNNKKKIKYESVNITFIFQLFVILRAKMAAFAKIQENVSVRLDSKDRNVNQYGKDERRSLRRSLNFP